MNTESEKQNLWQKLTGGKGEKRVPFLAKLLIGLVI